MNRRDLSAIVIIGVAVGLLSQPILANIAGSFNIPLTVGLRVGVFFGFLILAPLALFILSFFGRIIPVLYQFGKFVSVGVLNTFVDLGVLNLEIVALGTPGAWGYRIFKAVSFLAATTNSFLWNKFWTFDSREPANTLQTIKFYAVAAGGFLLNVGVASYVFSNVARPESFSPNLWANVGAIMGVAAAFLWDFIGYKYFVFKKTGPSA
jgi:putative flippase GtrA